VVDSAYSVVNELGMIEMALAGPSIGVWGRDLEKLGDCICQAFEAVWNFQEDTGYIHGDCHIANVLWSLDQKEIVLIDFERSVRLADIKVTSDAYTALRIIDILHLMKSFYSVKTLKHLMHGVENDGAAQTKILKQHGSIWQRFVEKLMPKHNLLCDSTLKKDLEKLYGTGESMQNYSQYFEPRHDKMEAIFKEPWFERNSEPLCLSAGGTGIPSPRALSKHLNFLDMIVFSKTNQCRLPKNT
jgi:hypothetical protein